MLIFHTRRNATKTNESEMCVEIATEMNESEVCAKMILCQRLWHLEFCSFLTKRGLECETIVRWD